MACAAGALSKPCMQPGMRHTSSRALPHRLPAHAAARRGAKRVASVVVVRAGGNERRTGNATLDSALEISGNLVNSAADLVPASVPRGVAKGGVALVGGLVVFGLLQKVVSTVLTIALLGGAAWFYFSQSSGSSGDSSSSSSGSSKGGQSDDVDLNDPLAEARRIMSKYDKK